MAECKGRTKDGKPCKLQGNFTNGYCRHHQNQTLLQKASAHNLPWTRERLVSLIATKGGSKGLDLSGADFSHLELSNISLGGAKLTGAWFWSSNLQNSSLRNADIREAKFDGANLQNADLTLSSLQGAILDSADLRGAIVVQTNLQRADLTKSDLRGANLWGSDLRNADLRYANIEGVDLLNLHGGLWGVKLNGVKLDRTLIRKEQLEPGIAEERAGEYPEAKNSYLALKQNFESLGDYDAAGWAYIKERQMERASSAPRNARKIYGVKEIGDTYFRGSRINKRSTNPKVWLFYTRHTIKWLSDWIVELTCGYGEQPLRTLFTMFFVYWVFVCVYWTTWAVVKLEQTPSGTMQVSTRNIVDIMLFGLGAFTTMGAKGLEARNQLVEFVAGIETLLAIGLTGLLGFVLGNRIRRS